MLYIEGSKVIIKTNTGNGSQILTAAGTNVCELHLEDSDGISLTTWTFHIVVEPRVHDGSNMSSIDSYDVLDNMINMEKERIANEKQRLENELQRKENETNRNTVFEQKLDETNSVITDCRLVIDTANQKINNFDAEINEIVDGITNEAQSYADNAKASETNAANAASSATDSAAIASQKAGDAAASAALSQSYAVGGTGTREGEDADNAKEYAKQVQEVLQNLQRTTVTGVKGNKESTYRTGEVNITPENVGALSLTGGTMKTNSYINMPSNSGISSGIYLSSSVDDYTMNIHPGELSVHHNTKNTLVSSTGINTPALSVGEYSKSITTMLPDKIETNTKHFEIIVDSDSNIGWETEVTKNLSETTLSFYGKNATFIKVGTSAYPIGEINIKTDGAINTGIYLTDNEARYRTSMTPAEFVFYNRTNTNSCCIATSYLNVSGSIFPTKTNDGTLGLNTNKWKEVYATNGTIQTSDRNEKNTIEELSSEKAQQLIYGLKPSTYKMNAGTSGRTHWGMISQDIEEMFEEIGMTSLDFAGFIKSPKMTEEVRDEETGKIIKESKVIEGEYNYSLRYDEFIAPIIKVIQTQHEELEALKQKIELLERQAQINSMR